MQGSHRAASWLFCLVCFSVLFVSLPVMASDPQAILLQFKKAITNDSLGALHSWTNESPFCQWQGINCTNSIENDSEVQSIALVGLKLQGSITPLIGGLTSLVSLDLSNNAFSGSVPSSLGMLSSLKILDLSYNVLSGSVPSALGMLSSLKILDLSNNVLSGSVPSSLGMLSSLEILDLSNNALFRSVPSSLGMLSSLQTLQLSSNRFVGSIPASLSNCSLLILLNVSDNLMSGSVPVQLGALSTLKSLLLSHNLFNGTLSPSIFNASALLYLDVSHNSITGVLPNIVGNNQSLLLLNLSSNLLIGPIPHSLSKLVALQGLDVSNNMLSGGIRSQLSNFTKLGTVMLSNNRFTGHIPTRLGEMQSLRVLQLNNNFLSGSIPSSLGNFTSLEDLVLSHNLLDGGIPIAVASLSNLLISFDVSHNSLMGPIPPQIGGMAKVLKIDLAHNKLTGNIPEGIGGCSGLQYLDLSNNQLKGPTPLGIGSLISLTWINLSYNSLEGSIPDLHGLNYLRIIDLSHNELTGLGSPSLSSLKSLVFFNLSFNRLSGCFPQDGTFVSKHINSSWIQGNPDLCVPFLPGFCICSSDASAQRRGSTSLVSCIRYLLSTALLIWLGIGIYFCFRKLLKFSPYTTSQDQTSLVISIMKRFNVYSTADLNSVINCMDTSSLIGSGASSDVYKVQFGNGPVCALKCFKPTARQQLFNTELEVLMNLSHRNLVSIRGFCKQGTTRAIILDYMENGSLKKQLHDMPKCTLDLERRIEIARDVAEGLLYLHSYGEVPIIHCDVKSANILLDKKYKAHIADFGLATYAMGGLTNAGRKGQPVLSSSLLRLPGTIGYIAPEYAAFKTIPSKAGDVYSYGVVVLELLTRRQPGQGNLPPGIYSLPALVRLASRDDNLESVLDPDLRPQMRTKLHYDKVSLLASIGLACASDESSARPSMEQVVSSLKYHHTFLEHNSEDSSKDGDEVLVNADVGVEREVADGVLANKRITIIRGIAQFCISWVKKKDS